MLAQLRRQIPGKGKQIIRHTKAYNGDLRAQIESDFLLAKYQTKKFADRFKGADRRSTAKNVHDFIRRNFIYLKDAPENQQIKLPSRLLKDLTGDCKSVSLFAAAILSNIGLPVSFKYASYDKKQPTPSHIYVTTQDESGNEIIVDGTAPTFDFEKPPAHSFYKDLNMKVVTLSDEVLADQVLAGEVLADEHLAAEAGKVFFQRMRKMRPDQRKRFLGKFSPRNRGKLMQSLRSQSKLMKMRRAGGRVAIQEDPYDPFYEEYDEVYVEEPINGKFKRKRQAKKAAKKEAKAKGASKRQARKAGQAAKKQVKLESAKPGSRKERVLKRKVQKKTIKATTEGKEKKAAMKDFRKNVRRPQVKEAAKKVGKFLNKINPVLATGRGAFLALVRLNMRGMASKMAKGQELGKIGEVRKKWEKMGGKWSRMEKAINKGKGRKALLGKGKGLDGIGDGGISAGVAGAAAAPVLAAIIPLLKKFLGKEDQDELDGLNSEAQADAKMPKLKQFVEKVKDWVEDHPAAGDLLEQGQDALDDYLQDRFGQAEGDEPMEPSEYENSNNMLLYGGLGLLGLTALFLAFRKGK